LNHSSSNISHITDNQLTQFTVNAADSFAMSDNIISPFYTNNGQQSTLNENIASTSQTSQSYPQYDHPPFRLQLIELLKYSY